MEETPKTLRLYKASAGSGKTFRLAVEYIKLLLSHPTHYSRILAVTFTNKATSEMKARILSQLYGIANGLKSSDAYLQAIRQELQEDSRHSAQALASNEVLCRRRAKEALRLILDDYSHFRVETIDSYFSSLLREVARELMLPNDFRTEIGVEEPLRRAVQDLFDSLSDDRRLFDSLLSVLQGRVLQQQNWQIREELEQFGQQLFNERFLAKPREEREQAGQVARLAGYREFLKTRTEDACQRCEEAAKSFFERCAWKGLGKEDLYGKGSPFDFFDKLRDPRKVYAADRSILTTTQWERMRIDEEGKTKYWLSAAQRKKNKRMEEWVKQQLIPLQRQAVEGLQELYTLQALRKNLDALAFVHLVNEHIKRLNEQEHRFLLSDTAHLLGDLIDDSDIPFIFERTGERFSHIMIDEFQDTSALQWQNFIPLVANATASGKDCLIVGDVKQSIYRWRNSDWSILNELDRQPAFRDAICPIEQRCNFRSGGVVVDFNNRFFERSSERLARTYFESTGQPGSDILAAYAGIVQEWLPEQDGQGYVSVQLIGKEGEESKQADTVKETEMERVAEALRQLLNKGVPASEIAILTRTNDQISDLIAYLTPLFPDTPFISSAAYRLNASPAVNILVQALRVVSDPDDEAQRIALASLWHQALGGGNQQLKHADHHLFSARREALNQLLPSPFVEQIYELPLKPLYDLCEALIPLFRLTQIPGQDAYLVAFLDLLAQQLAQHSCSLDEFISLWDRTLCEETVPMEQIDGVQLLTIHKAKGLEFHSVIVPFAEWSMAESKGDILWCDTPELLRGPKDAQLPFVPVTFSSRLTDTYFAKDYAEELKRQYVDHLNLLYVAFTRAEQNLFIIAKAPTQNRQVGPSASSMLERFAKTYGALASYARNRQTQAKQVESNPLLWPTTPISLPLQTHTSALQLRQSQRAKDFFSPSARTASRERGILLHELLSRLRTPDDLPRVVRQAQCEGLIEQVQPMEDLLRSYLQQEEAAAWFDPHWQVINECTILACDSQGALQRWRPDRVVCDEQQTIVIDFKTGQPRREHETQVSTYMQCLRDMGYPRVQGRIWYTDSQRIIHL